MATVYEIEVVSDWVNWHPNDLKKMIQKAIEDKELNTVRVTVKEKGK